MTTEHRAELARLLALPWSLRTHRDENGCLVAEIGELPEFIAAADNEDDFATAFWDSLRSLLSSYLAAGDRIPEPAAGAGGGHPSMIGTYLRYSDLAGRGSATPPFGSNLIKA